MTAEKINDVIQAIARDSTDNPCNAIDGCFSCKLKKILRETHCLDIISVGFIEVITSLNPNVLLDMVVIGYEIRDRLAKAEELERLSKL